MTDTNPARERLDRLDAMAEATAVERKELREVFVTTMKVLAEFSQDNEVRMAQHEARMAQHEERTAQHEARMAQNEERLKRMDEAILASQVLQGHLAEQTLQLKNAVDYLLSKDGSN